MKTPRPAEAAAELLELVASVEVGDLVSALADAQARDLVANLLVRLVQLRDQPTNRSMQ